MVNKFFGNYLEIHESSLSSCKAQNIKLTRTFEHILTIPKFVSVFDNSSIDVIHWDTQCSNIHL